MDSNINFEITMLLRIGLATVFGVLIGIERHKNGKIAGIRTFATIALGTSIFTLMSTQVGSGIVDPMVIAAIVIGAGLLSSRMMVVDGEKKQDFSNIAAVWTTAAISVAFALGLYILGSAAAAILLLIFWLKDFYSKI
jgi:putative Mg2+ transporter-C (MgtC) family protein